MDRTYLRFTLLTMQMIGIPCIGKIHRYDGQSAMMTKTRQSISYHHERIANPERIPSLRTTGNLDGLTVNCDHHGWSFTYCTSGNGKGGEHNLHSEYVGTVPLLSKPSWYRSPLRCLQCSQKQEKNALQELLFHKPSLPIYLIKL